MNTFTAAPQALGYLYQARYSLFLALQKPDDHLISIEKFDDVAFEMNGTAAELLQLKHHVTAKSLTDSSPDLWKTIRVWSTAITQKAMQPSAMTLLIVTTANAPDDSVASLLRSGKGRNESEALRILRQIAASSQNQALVSAFAAFQQLSQQEQHELVAAVAIIDSASDIIGVKRDIEHRLRLAVRPQYLSAMYERLEGWWFGQVIDHLAGRSETPIPCSFVRSKIDDLREQFSADALPIDTFDINDADSSMDGRQFVSQLLEIRVNPGRINKAILDHDRAFAQRSKWLREELLEAGEIDTYEAKLVDEWDRQVLAQQDRDDRWQSTDEGSLQGFGQDVFYWVDRVADIKIRPRVSEPHIMRGSYHMLADHEPPYVWWHPQYLQRRHGNSQS